ncbi:MAG: ABC transporter substrate-binding protein [Alphaproteobacteria bacterium]|nr:ABC transporter substrate-binding protein [Alphaproteobacteria bacterium]
MGMVCAAGLFLAMPSALAEDGVTPTEIRVGQVAALEGPASALGNGMRIGLLTAFAEVNAKGGVNGRQITLVSRDDSYEPEDSAAQTKAMIEEEKVFALIGPVGTPTTKSAQPIATAAGVPFIGPFTGAGFLRDGALTNVVNVRASYNQETEEWVKRLTEDLGVKSIAIVYQNDAFGQAGLSGVEAAMTKRGLTLSAKATYERNTIAVEEAVASMVATKPDAVVMVGAYAPCAEFIRQARKAGLDATYVNISFVGSDALAEDLGADGEGVVITQVVPFPWDESLSIVKDYHAALAAHGGGEKPGFVSLEGYLVGRFFIAALEKAGSEPTRASLLSAISSTGTFDLGGFTLNYGAGDNQGSDQVFFTVIKADGSFMAIDKLPGSQAAVQ